MLQKKDWIGWHSITALSLHNLLYSKESWNKRRNPFAKTLILNSLFIQSFNLYSKMRSVINHTMFSTFMFSPSLYVSSMCEYVPFCAQFGNWSWLWLFSNQKSLIELLFKDNDIATLLRIIDMAKIFWGLLWQKRTCVLTAH